MNNNPDRTIREIVTENAGSARVFESLGIDYCCGGQRTLRDACTRAGASLDGVLNLLAQAGHEAETPETISWVKGSLGNLIAHIVEKHHSFVRRETPRLESLLAKVVSKHGPAHAELGQIQELFSATGQELATHMLKEEHILFPYIEKMEAAGGQREDFPGACFGSVQAPIANMIADHEDAGALLSRMRQLSGGYVAPEGACPSYQALYRGLDDFERDLHQHIHLENNILFPRAIELERSASEIASAAR